MSKHALTIPSLSLHNLRGRPFRTVCLLILVALLSFVLFGGAILTHSLQNGLGSLQQRLGADLMIVPEGYEAQLEGVLLKGEPNYFYFNKSIAADVAKISGVEKVTTQFFLASLSQSCCSVPVQLIAFDPATDFVVQPWIAQTFTGKLADGQVIAGNSITIEPEGTLKFFRQHYPVAARLSKTGTGLDASVFMTMTTMQSLVKGARGVGMNFLSDKQPEGAISSVLVKLSSVADRDAVAKDIRKKVSGVEVIVSRSIIGGIASSLNALVSFVSALSVALWALSFLVLAIVFSVTINERKKEFAVLRILGATRKRLVALVLGESLLLSAAGGLVGAGLAALAVFPFSTYIADRLQLPYLLPSVEGTLVILAQSLLLAIAVGPLTASFSAAKISRVDTYQTLREGE